MLNNQRISPLAVAVLLSLSPMIAVAQTKPAKPPTSSSEAPPQAEAWIDIATHASDVPGMATMSGFASGGLSGGLSSLFGGNKTGGNIFGNTRIAMAPGKWLDVSVRARGNPSLSEATMTVPSGMNLSKPLALNVPPPEKYDPPVREGESVPPKFERPKGKLSLYWGCGDTIRAGQPRVLDAATASLADLERFFGTIRNSTTMGARSESGHPSWPNKTDDRKVPESASMAGEHGFTGNGLPDNFKLTLGTNQEFMPPFNINKRENNGATELSWQSVSGARGYFISAVGIGGKSGGNSSGKDELDMIIWTSSQVPELGFALPDYQTNGSIDKWIAERAVLSASTTSCTVPKGIFGETAGGGAGGFVRAVAYGNEAFFSYPPRVAGAKVQEPLQWRVKTRNKSTFMTILGMEGMGDAGGSKKREEKSLTPTPADLLKGIFGR